MGPEGYDLHGGSRTAVGHELTVVKDRYRIDTEDTEDMNTESKPVRSSVPRAAGTGLLVLAAALGAFALLFVCGERLDVVEQADLEMLHGTVFRVETRGTAKVSRKINIYLQDDARVIHLTQDDFACCLASLQPHDQVTAWAKKDSLGRGMFWLWKLDRGTDRLYAVN